MHIVATENFCDLLFVFNSIYIKQLDECRKHLFKYKLLGTSYNPKYDAVGLTYYKILEDYPDDIKLINRYSD